MFAGFNVKLNIMDNDYNLIQKYAEWEEKQLQIHKKQVEKDLKTFLKEGLHYNIMDGTALENDWFSQVKADIFLSYSHQDEKMALALAYWLFEEFDLICFVDSSIWGYGVDLLREINNIYSRSENKINIFDYNKCNIASQHVNLMLSNAIQKMIDGTEAIFFLNTPNSVRPYKDCKQTITGSPWIYTEVLCSQIVRKKPLSEYRIKPVFNEINKPLWQNIYAADYNISLNHLQKVDRQTLQNWKKLWGDVKNQGKRYALDALYTITYPEECKALKEFFS